MSSVADYDQHRLDLEGNIAASKSLLADLHQSLKSTTGEFEREKLEVNIEDVARKLKDWEYELHLLTSGKE